ncbi:MAG TPA: hypothetical protein VFC54_03435 [Pseudolabrys sp.]|nr:hypothetical protein [Pseudolabrys sp.]
MTLWNRGIQGAVGGLVLLVAVAPAVAQENLDKGKTAAQLFASDCAICHKSPQGLAKSGGLLGVDNFLRQHYTASRESADVLAKYLQATGDAPVSAVKRGARTGRGSDKDQEKSAAKKPSEGKAKKEIKENEAKPSEAKANGETKPEAKSESKPEPKAEPKSEPKPEAKSEPKAEAKPEPKAEAKPEPKSEAKPDSKPEKSD